MFLGPGLVCVSYPLSQYVVLDFLIISHLLVTVTFHLSAPSRWPQPLWSASASVSMWSPSSPLLTTVAPSRWRSGETSAISVCLPYLFVCVHAFTFTFTYPLTMRVIWAPQMISQLVSSVFLCSPLPSGTCQTPGLSTLLLSALSPSPFHCASQDGFGQTW